MGELVQQINLYRPSTVHESAGLTFKKMLLFWGAIVLCLMSYTGFLLWDQSSSKKNYENFSKENAAMRQDLDKTIAKLNGLESEKNTREEINQLIEKRNEQAAIIAILLEQGLDQAGGFSPIFKALSAQHVQGTWYTEIFLQNNGQYLTLKGSAVKPALIPKIFESLDQAALFEGKSFDTVGIQANEQNSSVDFSISSQNKRKE